VKGVKAIDEKVLSKAELKEGLLSANAKINFSVSIQTKKED
jgi:hypothetical protein